MRRWGLTWRAQKALADVLPIWTNVGGAIIEFEGCEFDLFFGTPPCGGSSQHDTTQFAIAHYLPTPLPLETLEQWQAAALMANCPGICSLPLIENNTITAVRRANLPMLGLDWFWLAAHLWDIINTKHWLWSQWGAPSA
jgi:hypothetical protein